MTWTSAVAWAQEHQAVLLGTLVALAVVLAFAVLRRSSLAALLRGIAIPLVLLYEAQGLYLLTLGLGVPRDAAPVLSGVACAIILTLAAHAHEHYERTGGRENGGNLGPCGRWMWYVAVPMGLIVAASETTLAGAGMRVILPLLSVLAFRARYVPDEPAGPTAKRGQWRASPRRLGVAPGLIDPTDADLTQIHTERRIRQLTSHSAGYHTGLPLLRRWHGWRFGKLALAATDEMITEAGRRVRRASAGLATTSPGGIAAAVAAPRAATPVAGASDASRDGISEATPAPTDDGTREAPSQSPPGAVAKVRRKGTGAASDDEIKAAIRELRENDPDLNMYRIGKALENSRGSTIGDRRAARLLAEVQAERPTLQAVASPRAV